MGEALPAVPRLLSAAEAAKSINPALDAPTFQRIADRLGTPYHKLGRQRFYDPAEVAKMIDRTKRCPEEEEARDLIGGAERGSSAGRKADEAASAAQARQIAEKLKKRSSASSQSGANGPAANVVPMRT